MGQRMRALWSLVSDTYERFQRDHGDLLAAGLSFYALLSIAPLTLLAVGTAGLVLERDAARAELLKLIRSVASNELAADTARLLTAVREQAEASTAIIALAILLWAASRLFVQLQVALNVIWGVRVKPASTRRGQIQRLVGKRVVSFFMIAGCGGLLLILVLLDSILTRAAAQLDELAAWLSVPIPVVVGQNLMLSLLALTLLFAGIYRVLPDTRIHWRDVWVGAGSTALLVLVGTALLSLYLGRTQNRLAEGVLGSLAAFTLWTYYLAQVFLFGAAFTRTWADRSKGRIEPEQYAEREASLPTNDDPATSHS